MKAYCNYNHKPGYTEPIFLIGVEEGKTETVCILIIIDGQVHLVRLQSDNFCLFLCQQMDKRQTSVCTMRKLAWASIFQWMSPCLHVHVFMSLCCHVSTSPFFHLSWSPYLCHHVSMSPSSCLNVSIYPCLHVHVSKFLKICKLKTELTENGNFQLVSATEKMEMANLRLFAVNVKGNRKLVFLGRQKTNGNRVIDNCCFSKRAHLW